MDTGHPSELGWRRAREARTRAGAIREQSGAVRERADHALTEFLGTLGSSTGRPLGDHGSVFKLLLPGVPQAVRLARNDLRRWLERDGATESDAIDIALACSEACANAVEHAGDPARHVFEVEAQRDRDVLQLTVRDFGSWSAPAEQDDTRGRGLAMMRGLMDSVEVASDAAGTQVLMRRTLGRSSARAPAGV
jgi:anti-sigma regulatory factor (Ser/Thr protein kinase)